MKSQNSGSHGSQGRRRSSAIPQLMKEYSLKSLIDEI